MAYIDAKTLKAMNIPALRGDDGRDIMMDDKVFIEFNGEDKEGYLRWSDDYMRFEVEVDGGNAYARFGYGEIGRIVKADTADGEADTQEEEKREYTLVLDDIANEVGVSARRVIEYATNRVIGNAYDYEVVTECPYTANRLADLSRAIHADLSQYEDDDVTDWDSDEMLKSVDEAIREMLKRDPMSVEEATEVIRYFDEDVISFFGGFSLCKEYLYTRIEKVADENDLEIVETGSEVIGEEFLELKDDGDTVASFVLSGATGNGYVYRCAYVSDDYDADSSEY